MKKPCLILLIFHLLITAHINAQERKYANKDSVFIKKVILKWSPLALWEVKRNVAISLELPLKPKRALNIQIGYIFKDNREFYPNLNWSSIEDYKQKFNNKINFIIRAEHRWIKKIVPKNRVMIYNYTAFRTDYHYTSYAGSYLSCTEWKEIRPQSFLSSPTYECIKREEVKYVAHSHQIGYLFIWGKEYIFRNRMVFDIYSGLGIRMDYNHAPKATTGLPYPGHIFDFSNLDFGPNHLKSYENELKVLPIIAAGFRIGYNL